MNIYEKIKTDKLQSLKNKDKLKKNLLTTIFSDCENFKKEKHVITDIDSVKILKKFKKIIKEVI